MSEEKCSYCGKPLNGNSIPIEGLKFHYPDCYKKWVANRNRQKLTPELDKEIMNSLENVLSGVNELSRLLKLKG